MNQQKKKIRGKGKRGATDAAQKHIAVDLSDQNLKKHIAAIHISNRLTLTQRKASNVLLHHAYETLLTARVHRIRVKDLAEAIGFNTHNLDPLKEALKTLARTVLEWNILDENGAQAEWGATTLLAQAVIKGGYCIYAYSPDLCEKLYRPEIYALLNLSIQRKFSSSYALALYENCLRYRRVGTTGWIVLDNLKRLLGIGETDQYYQDFRKFNDKVIKPAIRQVNETSDLLVDVAYQRQCRRVVAVRFQVSDNPQMLLFAQQQTAMTASEEQIHEVDEASRHELLREKLATLGLTARQIRLALASHTHAYLEENIAVVERDLVAGKVHNLPAYLLAALREDYRSVEARSQLKDGKYDANCSRGLSHADSSGGLAATQEQQLSTRSLAKQLQAALDGLTPQEQTLLERDYVLQLGQSDGFESHLILKLYQKNGMNSKVVESHFRAFARERLIGSNDTEYTDDY